jgi:hypothetical protein
LVDKKLLLIYHQIMDDKRMKDQAALLVFIDDLIKERKDPNIKPESLNEVRALLLKELNDDINTQLINLMSPKDQADFDIMLDKNPTDEEIAKFFEAHVPNIEVEVAAVLLRFKSAYLYPVTKGQAAPAPAPVSPAEPPPAPVMPSFKKPN